MHIVAKIRARARITQAEVAARLGVSQAAISRYETGGALPAPMLRRVRDWGREVFGAEWSDEWLFDSE